MTTSVMLLKHETEAKTHDEEDVLDDALTHSVSETYMHLWRIVHLPAILSLIATLLTYRVRYGHCIRFCSMRSPVEARPLV